MFKNKNGLGILFGALLFACITYINRNTFSTPAQTDIPSPHSVVQEPVEPTSTGSITTTRVHEEKTSLSGRVLDSLGNGVSGAAVMAFPATRSLRRCCMQAPVTPTTKTDEKGWFTFTDLHPGVELIAFRGTGSLVSRVVDTAGPHILTFPQGKYIEGMVQDSEGSFLSHIKIRSHVRPERAAALSLGKAIETVTQADGSFQIGPVAPGTSVLLEISGENYMASRSTVLVTDGTAPAFQQIILQKGDHLTGSIASANGTPLSNVLLTAHQKDGVSIQVRSSKEGTFEISGLAQGEVQIVAQLPGFISSSVSVFDTSDTVQIELRKSQSLDGRISPAQSGLYAVVVDGYSRFRTPVAPDGTFHLPTLSSGHVKILIESEDRNILTSRQVELNETLTNVSISLQ